MQPSNPQTADPLVEILRLAYRRGLLQPDPTPLTALPAEDLKQEGAHVG